MALEFIEYQSCSLPQVTYGTALYYFINSQGAVSKQNDFLLFFLFGVMETEASTYMNHLQNPCTSLV